MATTDARNARLDQLKLAADAWATKEKKRLKDDAALLRRILKGRTGSERLNNVSVTKATDLLVDEVNQFLSGD